MDERQEADIASVIQDYLQLSALGPTTFYNATCYELSGRGYTDYLNYSGYLRDLRRQFVLFWIERVYYHGPKIMKNFITGDENIYRSRGNTPPNFSTGCLIMIFYIIILYIISYLVFKRSLYHIPAKDISKLGKVDIKMKIGDLIVKLIKGNLLGQTLYSIFSGNIKQLDKKGFKGDVCLDDRDIIKQKNPEPFVFICHPDNIPDDIKVKYLLRFYSRWNNQSKEEREKLISNKEIVPIMDRFIWELEIEDKFVVVMSRLEMSKGHVYLIDDLTSDLPMEQVIQFKNKIDEITRQGALVVYLTTPRMLEVESIKKGIYFVDGMAWVYKVESSKQFLKYQEKINEERKNNEKRK